ncbi:MAG: hypothetical protein U9N78_00965, partial [Actinomycetota bacterium]|nr:hypothetical protein [Actinomycetota bacterium]
RDVQDVGDPADVLLIGHRNATVDQLNRRARSIVAETGHLEGPTLSVGDRVFQTGDRVVCLKNRARLGVLNGDLGTVTAVDTERRAVTICLDRTSDAATVPDWYLEDGHLDWGYALTGHKAQGTTTRRAHTVADAGVDREWVYVTMSRGRESNTIYLTEPELADECEHLTHQHPERIPGLIAALARTATKSAALDTGRGPKTVTNEQLAQQLAGVGVEPGANGGDEESSIEYLELEREIQARHSDKLATVAYEPPDWVTNTLGERPADHDRRAAWDVVVDRALRYRTEHGIPEDAADLLGPQPPSSDVLQRVAWIAAQRATQCDLRLLTTEQEQGRSAMGR